MNALPDSSLWPGESIRAIHDAALQVLDEVGVRVDSDQARELLTGAGGTVASDGRVRLGREVVLNTLESLSASFVLAARDPGRDLTVDSSPGPTYVHNLGETAYVLNAATGESREAGMADQVVAARLMHHISNQHFVTPLVSPQDVPGDLMPLYSYFALASETDKYVSGPGISRKEQVRWLWEMAQIAVADADQRDGQVIDVSCSPVPPLHFGAEVTSALVEAARRGVVCDILSCPTLGTTAPVTMAAGLAMQHAEILAGVTIVQAANPGTPCVYGARLSACDLRSGEWVSGTPEFGLAGAGAALLARLCGLPADVYGLSTDSSVLDGRCCYEKAVNCFAGASARPRFLSGVGFMASGASACFESMAFDEEILAHVLYDMDPKSVDSHALDVQAIVDGARKGDFLSSPHTRRHVHREPFRRILDFGTGRSSIEVARNRVAHLVAESGPELPDDTLIALAEVVERAARELGLAEFPDPLQLMEQSRAYAAKLSTSWSRG